ncbi:MAG: hypothetical protein AAF696_25920 [Bacteroidota bacterium]
MIKSTSRIIALISLTIILISCKNPSTSSSNENQTTIDSSLSPINEVDFAQNIETKKIAELQTHMNEKAAEFVQQLTSGKDLSSFFHQSWTFIYHEDNRCEGSTDGQVDHLSKTAIDSLIKLEVKKNGDGWACKKKEPTSYELGFDLKQKIKNWNRFELEDYENQEGPIFYVLGAGESDYIELQFDDQALIIKLAYKSEDPG